MKKLSLVLAASLSLAGSACQGQPTASPTLGTFTSDQAGFDTHSFYLDTGREVVVFDAQFTEGYAEEVIADIRARTSSPITWVVITHPNPDKFNGAPAFQAIGAKVVASAETAAAIPAVHAYKKAYFISTGAFTEATYPKEAHVDLTFEGQLDLPLSGGAHVHLATLAHAAVATTQTVAHIPELSALVVGDMVHHETHAWLEGGIKDKNEAPTPDLGAWKLALDELSAYPGTTVYGGRGPAAPVSQAVAGEQAYLARMDAIVAQYVDGLPDKSVLSGAQAGAAWQDITKLADQAFPTYACDYLITYGVYGLALEDAQR